MRYQLFRKYSIGFFLLFSFGKHLSRFIWTKDTAANNILWGVVHETNRSGRWIRHWNREKCRSLVTVTSLFHLRVPVQRITPNLLKSFAPCCCCSLLIFIFVHRQWFHDGRKTLFCHRITQFASFLCIVSDKLCCRQCWYMLSRTRIMLRLMHYVQLGSTCFNMFSSFFFTSP